MTWVLSISVAAAVLGAAFTEVHAEAYSENDGYDCKQAFPDNFCSDCWTGAPWLMNYTSDGRFEECDPSEHFCHGGGGFDGDYIDFLCDGGYDWSLEFGEKMEFHGEDQPRDNKQYSDYTKFRRYCNGTSGRWSTHQVIWDENGGPEGEGGYAEDYDTPLPTCATEGDGKWSNTYGTYGAFSCCIPVPTCDEDHEEIFPHMIGKGFVEHYNSRDNSHTRSPENGKIMSGATAWSWCSSGGTDDKDGEGMMYQEPYASYTYGYDYRECVCDSETDPYDCHWEDVDGGGALEGTGRCQSCIPFDEPADITTTYSNTDKSVDEATGHYDTTTASFVDNCPEGYAMYPSANDATIMCDSGFWDGDPPSCVQATTITTTTGAPCDDLDLSGYANIAAVYTDGNNAGSAAQFYCALDGESTDNDDRTLTCTNGAWEGDLSGLACTPCTGTNPKTGEEFTGDALSGPWHLYKKDHLGSVSVALNDAKVWEASFSCKGSNFRFFEDGDYTNDYEDKVLTCRNGVWSDESRDASYDGQLPYCCRKKGYTTDEYKRCCTRSGGTYNAASGALGNGYCSGSSAIKAGAEGSGVLIAAVKGDDDDDGDDDNWRPFEVYVSVVLTAAVVLIAVGVLIVARRPSGAAPPSAAVLSGPGSKHRRGSGFSMHHIDHHRVDDHDELHPMDSPTGRESPSILLTPAGPAKHSTISEL